MRAFVDSSGRVVVDPEGVTGLISGTAGTDVWTVGEAASGAMVDLWAPRGVQVTYQAASGEFTSIVTPSFEGRDTLMLSFGESADVGLAPTRSRTADLRASSTWAGGRPYTVYGNDRAGLVETVTVTTGLGGTLLLEQVAERPRPVLAIYHDRSKCPQCQSQNCSIPAARVIAVTNLKADFRGWTHGDEITEWQIDGVPADLTHAPIPPVTWGGVNERNRTWSAITAHTWRQVAVATS